MDACLDIPRIASASPRELEMEYIRKGLPVVLTNAIDDWPAIQRWSFEYLRASAGDVRVPVRGNRHHLRLYGTTTLGRYLDWLTGERDDPFLEQFRSTAPYISHNRGITPRLAMDTDFSRFTPDGYVLQPPSFWIGPSGAETPLHYDAVGIVFFAQIVGRKEAILFPSHESRYLYESDYFDFTTCYSRVNLRDVDRARFPLFDHARAYRFVLEPGEVLVFPRRLWHEFRLLDTGVSVTAHAGTAWDYSWRNPMLVREKMRQTLHWFGLYARRRCACHSITKPSQWEECMDVVSNSMAKPKWIRESSILSALADRISRSSLHDKALGDLLDWSEKSEGAT